MDRLEKLDMNKSNPAGLLHQLNRFDAAHVEEMRKTRLLGQDMTKKFLSNFMLKGASSRRIDAVIKKFSESSEHKSHGRPIWPKEAKQAGLKISIIRQNGALWNAAYELLQRYDHTCLLYAMRADETYKIMETKTTSHRAHRPLEQEEDE